MNLILWIAVIIYRKMAMITNTNGKINIVRYKSPYAVDYIEINRRLYTLNIRKMSIKYSLVLSQSTIEEIKWLLLLWILMNVCFALFSFHMTFIILLSHHWDKTKDLFTSNITFFFSVPFPLLRMFLFVVSF